MIRGAGGGKKGPAILADAHCIYIYIYTIYIPHCHGIVIDVKRFWYKGLFSSKNVRINFRFTIREVRYDSYLSFYVPLLFPSLARACSLSLSISISPSPLCACLFPSLPSIYLSIYISYLEKISKTTATKNLSIDLRI